MADLQLERHKEYPNGVAYRKYVCESTGATVEIVHDPGCENMTFGLGFATIPDNSKGIPHILEHSVLCGSKKYPLKDPFSALLRTSVQTFLNAITFHNMTLYPSASFVEQDFKNLFDVYWDAVFNPLLLEETFWTQGIHPIREGERVKFQGVVYNEMKGYYSEPRTLLWRSLFKGLFGNSHWQFDSGGDPREILELTYEELVNFHQTRYCLRNLRVVFYGPLGFEKLEGFIIPYLENARQNGGFRVVDDLNFEFQPSNQHELYQRSKPTDRFWKVVASFTNHTQNFVVGDLFNACYLGFATAPLIKALQDSNLGPNVVKTGVLDLPFGAAFVVGIQDLFREEDVNSNKLENLVFEILTQKIEHNLASSMYEHFKANFISNFLNNPNRGVEIIIKSAQNLAFDIGLDKVLDQIFDFVQGSFQESYSELDQLRFGILNAKTSISIILEPSETFESQFTAKEDEMAGRLIGLLDDETFEAIRIRLEEYRKDLNEDISIVPSLSRASFKREIKKIQLTQTDNNFFELVSTTNGLVYASLLFPLSVNVDAVLDLAFLCRIATQIGTSRTTPYEFSLKISESLSALEIYPFWGKDYRSNDLKCFLRFDLTFLEEKVTEAVSVLSELRECLDFTKQPEIIRKQLEEFRTELRSSLQASPQRFAKLFAQSYIDETGYLDDCFRGVRLIEHVEGVSLEQLIDSVRTLWAQVVSQEPVVFTTQFKESRRLNISHNQVNHKPFISVSLPEPIKCPVHIPVDVQVSSACRSFTVTKPLVYESRVLEKIISESYLWNEIRVKGGAYGSAMVSSNWGSSFTCLSWDDPTPERTLQIFSKISNDYFSSWLSEMDIERACVSTLGELESPLSPAGELGRAVRNTVFSVNDDDRQEYKNRLFRFNLDDFYKSLQELNMISKSIDVIVGKCDLAQISAVMRKELNIGKNTQVAG